MPKHLWAGPARSTANGGWMSAAWGCTESGGDVPAGHVSASPATAVARRMRSACLATACAGAVSMAMVVAADGAHIHRSWLFPFFTAVLLFAYGRPVRFWHDGGEAENMSLDEALFVPMALLLSPSELVLAIGAAITLGFLWRRAGWAKVVWNFGATTLSAAVGLATCLAR